MGKFKLKSVSRAAKEGKILHPEDLSAQELNAPLIESVIPDIEFRAVIEKAIEEAIRVGTEISKTLEDVKPIARIMICKTLYEHTMENDRKAVQMLKKSGLWESL